MNSVMFLVCPGECIATRPGKSSRAGAWRAFDLLFWLVFLKNGHRKIFGREKRDGMTKKIV